MNFAAVSIPSIFAYHKYEQHCSIVYIYNIAIYIFRALYETVTIQYV